MFRSRSPLRIGLAGGGTDVSPFSNLYGGAILNATISMYAYAVIEPTETNTIEFCSIDTKENLTYETTDQLTLDGRLDLIKGLCNRMFAMSGKKNLSFKLSTYVDAPPGSGLGSSSTLAVSILGAFSEWQKIPFGEYDLAHLAYEIERVDLKMAGGKQDQYAAAFGGFNFMEFYDNDKVIVNPLRIKQDYINELEFSILLYHTGMGRNSSHLIEKQSQNITDNQSDAIKATMKLKEQAVYMKEALLKGNLREIGEILDYGWTHKKKVAKGVTMPIIDEIYETAKKAGATGGKISGAGGGGFMMFYCPGNTRYSVIEALKPFGGEFRRFNFTSLGNSTWKSKR